MDALFRCLSRLDAYDVQIVREESDRWIVYLRPRPARCWDAGLGQRLIGGSATYEISRVDFSIISAQFWE